MTRRFVALLEPSRQALLEDELVARITLAVRGADRAAEALKAPYGPVLEESLRAVLAGFSFAIEEAGTASVTELAERKATATRAPSPAPAPAADARPRQEPNEARGEAAGTQPSPTPTPAPAPPAAAPAPAKAGDLSADDLAEQLRAMGFKPSDKGNLWTKALEGKGRLVWDFRSTPKGSFYGYGPDDKAIPTEALEARPEYKQLRLLQDRAQTTLPTSPPPTGGKPVLPTNLPAAGLKRLWLFIDTAKFREALAGWRFQPAGEGWWWADLAHEGIQARVAWAKLNKVPWWENEQQHDLPPGTPAPPKGVA